MRRTEPGRSRILLLLTCALALGVAGAASGAPVLPLDSTPAAVGHLAARVGSMTRSVAPHLRLDPAVVKALSACDGLESQLAQCSSEGAAACREALVSLYENEEKGLGAAEGRSALERAHGWVLAATAVDVVLRLQATLAAFAVGECDRVAPLGGTGAQVSVAPDRRTLQVRPLVALRGGRRWALVAHGLRPEALARLRETAVPRPRAEGGATVAKGSLVAPIEALGGYAGAIDRGAARELVEGVESRMESVAGVSGVAGVQLRLDEPLDLAKLDGVWFAFVPARRAPADETVVVLPVLDATAGFERARELLARAGCSEKRAVAVDADEILGKKAGDVALVARGTYRSLDLAGMGTADTLLDDPRAASPAIVERPYLLALPRHVALDGPLVLGVDGHGGEARRMIYRHAGALSREGLGLLAIDLVHHGERGRDPKRFLDVRAPREIAANLRQSVVDVLAAVHAAVDCGLVLPDGRRLRASEILYDGFSLGGMVGVMSRAVEPRIDTAVLFAPAGDVAGWLMQHVLDALGGRVVSCLGGSEPGQGCPTGVCPGGGVCVGDPFVFHVAASLALPYRLAFAGAEPLELARVRTGTASGGGALLLTGGNDTVLHPFLQNRLTDAYDMRQTSPNVFRGPGTLRLHGPRLAHGLIENEEVQAAGMRFLATHGRTTAPREMADGTR